MSYQRTQRHWQEVFTFWRQAHAAREDHEVQTITTLLAIQRQRERQVQSAYVEYERERAP